MAVGAAFASVEYSLWLYDGKRAVLFSLLSFRITSGGRQQAQ
jgi:hypothetical protein